MFYYNQKVKIKLSPWLRKHPHTEEYVINDLLFIYFFVLLATLFYAVIRL